MEGKFTAQARRAINIAFMEAARLGTGYVGTEHLLLGLASGQDKTAALLIDSDLDADTLREELTERRRGTVQPRYGEDMTAKLRRVLLRGATLAGAEASADSLHILFALMAEDCAGRRLAEELGDAVHLYEEMEKLMLEEKMLQRNKTPQRKPTPILDKNGSDLTERAVKGLLDPVIGREREEERVIQILSRRTKNNPCLIGEAGVGKTAVAESIALRIAEGRVPEGLKDKRLVVLDIASLVAGTKYRGEFEEKLRSIIDEVKEAGDIILFTDELHTIVGAGAAEGAVDASNILKPYLARGELQLMGATTKKEYRKYIEKDGALERRFQTVLLEEPDKAACLSILQGIKGRYESYHGVVIRDEALEKAVELADKYISGRSFPDKAIDLMDEAAAYKKTGGGTVVEGTDVETVLKTAAGISHYNSAVSEEALESARKRLYGREAELDKICAVLNRCRFGFGSGGALCSFLITGEAGVGKTALAKEMARLMFGKDSALLHMDMANYAEPHSLSRLIGTRGGEEGELTERLRRNQSNVLLFDNAHKACSEVLAVIKGILEEGSLTDGEGQRISCAGSVVVVTATSEHRAAGFEGGTAVSRRFGRIAALVDGEINLAPIGREARQEMVRDCVAELKASLLPMGISLAVDEDYALSLAEEFTHKGGVKRRLYKEAAPLLTGDFAKKQGEGVIFLQNGEQKLKISARNC